METFRRGRRKEHARARALPILFALFAAFAHAEPPVADYQQNLGATLPLNLTFRDEKGSPTRLGTYFGARPVVLVFVYFRCPNLCHVVLDGTLDSLRALTASVGNDYDVIAVSIDPADTPAAAKKRRDKTALRYGRPDSRAGWHFLTGDAEAIRALTDAAGFHYTFDPASQQYAHASGLLVATPAGRISRYFLGIEYPADAMREALAKARQDKIGSFTDRLLLLCFHYDPRTGRYGPFITRIVQLAGLGTVAALGLFLVRLSRKTARSA